MQFGRIFHRKEKLGLFEAPHAPLGLPGPGMHHPQTQCNISMPIPGVSPQGRRVLSYHGVGIKAFLIFPEILEAKEGVRVTEQTPLGSLQEASSGQGKTAGNRSEGGERVGGPVRPGWGMQGGGWQPQKPSFSPPSALTPKKDRYCSRGCSSWGIQEKDTQLRGSGLVGVVDTISPRYRNKGMRREKGAEPEHTAFPGVTQRELEPGVHRPRGQARQA